MPCSMIGSLASKESCDTRLAGTAALFSNHITGKKTVGTLARIVMPLTGAKSTFIWNLLQRLMRRICEKAILPSGDISWDARKRLHFEAGAMLDRVWTESRLDKGEVIGVGVQEVGLRDKHWGSIPGKVTLEYRSDAGEVITNLQRLVL